MAKKDSKPRSTPSTTTVTPSSLATTLTLFSPAVLSGSTPFFAHLHRAPDAHTLRVYEVISGKCISRWASNALGDEEEQRVNAIEWTLVPVAIPVAEEGDESSRGKKRRKSAVGSEGTADGGGSKEEIKAVVQPRLVLALGLESGAILLWSPNGSQSTMISHASSTSPVTALTVPVGGKEVGHLWSSHEDGEVRVWDLTNGTLIGRASGIIPVSTRWDSLAVRYLPVSTEGEKKRKVQLLLSHRSIHIFTLSLGKTKGDKVKDMKVTEIGRCTGHVEIGSVEFTGVSSSSSSSAATDQDAMIDSTSDSDSDDTTSNSISFLSYSAADRFVQIWSLVLPTTPVRNEATLIARLGLEAGVKSLTLAASPLDDEEEVMIAVDVAGRVALTRLPSSFPEPAVGKKAKKGVVALEIESEVVGRNGESAGITDVGIDAESKLSLCRGGVKPCFQIINFADENGTWSAKIELDRISAGLLDGSAMIEDASAPLPSRYVETGASNVRSGDAIPDVNSDDENELMNSGELDVDMAEPTLADRLKALNVNKALMSNGVTNGGDSADEEDEIEEEEDEEDESIKKGPSVPSATLTTTLIQALHSSDAPLLESCLSHTSPTLIRATVKRLSSGSLVLTLLEVLVERLGRGKKGKQGIASVKRSRGLIEWVRQVLIVHVGFLVTIPSLVTRLASLHSTLTSRLSLQPTLLALNGRLELVMSQIDLRQERVAAQASLGSSRQSRSSAVKKYVEGESGSESESEGEVGMEEDDEAAESDEDEGSVEDVVLGSDRSDEEDDDEEDDDEGSDEDLPSRRAKKNASIKANGKRSVNQFLDLEASDDEEESYDDDDDDDDDEDEDEDEESDDED